jgi:hypothetical protein
MNTNTLLQVCLSAFRQIPNTSNLSPVGDSFAEFEKFHTSYDIAAGIEAHLSKPKVFTVILTYPDSTETYSSTSKRPSWQEAVLAVAAEMVERGSVHEGDEIGIMDVFEGEVSSPAGLDRYSVVRVETDSRGKTHLCLIDQEEAWTNDYPVQQGGAR